MGFVLGSFSMISEYDTVHTRRGYQFGRVTEFPSAMSIPSANQTKTNKDQPTGKGGKVQQ
jgi:hypothetical protein